MTVLHFRAPLFWSRGLGATYDDHLRLIGKRVLVLRLRRYERISVQKSVILGHVYQKYQVEGVAPTNHSFFRNLGYMLFHMV